MACLAARGARVPTVTITSGFMRTNSAANAGKRSSLFSAYLRAKVMFVPSINPNSRKATVKAAHSSGVEPDPALKWPIVYFGCCARGAAGHAAAAPPSSVMNSRRPCLQPEGCGPTIAQWKVFGSGVRRNIPGWIRSALPTDESPSQKKTRQCVNSAAVK